MSDTEPRSFAEIAEAGVAWVHGDGDNECVTDRNGRCIRWSHVHTPAPAVGRVVGDEDIVQDAYESALADEEPWALAVHRARAEAAAETLPGTDWQAAYSRSEAHRLTLAHWADSLGVALRWVIEHKTCSDFPTCWAAAPAEVRGAITAAWASDPWPAPHPAAPTDGETP